jgi:hypothetical protein
MGIQPKFPEKKLLVEGNTDKYFIAQLWKKQMRTDALKHFTVHDCEGKENVILSLADFEHDQHFIWKTKPTTHLGIVIDADENAENTLQSVADALGRGGLSGFPKVLNAQGLICEINSVRLGVWIMPNNADAGMAEDLFLTLFPDEQNARQDFAKQTLKQLEANRLNLYDIDRQRSKVLAHTLLAWQEEPGVPMGAAVIKNYVKLPPERLPFVDWLCRLFS